MSSRDLFEKYRPLLEKLYRRRWVFDPDPLGLPVGFQGNIFRSERNTFCISLIKNMSRLPGRKSEPVRIRVTLPGEVKIRSCILYQPERDSEVLAPVRADRSFFLSIPSSLTAGVIEIT